MVPPAPVQFFDAQPADPGSERVDVLLEQSGLIIERITSSGTQPAQAYDQPQAEWVMLLRGNAELRVDGQLTSLRAGDFIYLPARTRHELLSTSENALWLAVHIPVGVVTGLEK